MNNPGGNILNQQGNLTNPNQVANLGAHEILMIHEKLSNTINVINNFEIYQQHVHDPELRDILNRQLDFMVQGYNNIVDYLNQKGAGHAAPYRPSLEQPVEYGLRNPGQESPNMSPNQLDDHDISAAMLGASKASAVCDTNTTLECTDPALRELMGNCIQSAVNMAYETFEYMHKKGYYQVPTLQANTTQTIIDSYQTASSPQMLTEDPMSEVGETYSMY